ncbi:31143_t:CDS:1, partial [Gigaspora margarita]
TFKKALLDESSKLYKARQKSYIRGLFVTEVKNDLSNLGLGKNEVLQHLSFFVRIVEKYLYEEIWQRHCNTVNQWKIKEEIMVKEKKGRKCKVNSARRKSNGEKLDLTEGFVMTRAVAQL